MGNDLIGSKKVYLYGTCTVDLFFPEAGMDALALLESLGKEVIFPQEQSCCGQPAYTSGYSDQAKKVALRQLNCLDQPYPVIVLSGSCAGMFSRHYPKLFANTAWHQKALDLASRTLEFSEYICRVAPNLEGLKFTSKKANVVLHTSCSARRETSTLSSSEQLVMQCASQPDIKIKNQTECCGFGGAFSVKQPELSAAIVNDKCQSITEANPDTLVSADCACLLNINGRLKANGEALQGKHIATFIKEHIS